MEGADPEIMVAGYIGDLKNTKKGVTRKEKGVVKIFSDRLLSNPSIYVEVKLINLILISRTNLMDFCV